MDASGITNEIETHTNGATPPSTVKPWIAAGFKTRDAWRRSKGQKTGKKAKTKKKAKKTATKSKPKKTAAAKKSVKKVKKVAKKVASKAKRKKPAKIGKGMIKDASMKQAKLADLSPKMKKVFLSVGKGKVTTLAQIQKKAFPNLPHKKANSTVRNQVRFLRVHKMFKLLGEGKYKRIA
jgi:hypothetical protein